MDDGLTLKKGNLQISQDDVAVLDQFLTFVRDKCGDVVTDGHRDWSLDFRNQLDRTNYVLRQFYDGWERPIGVYHFPIKDRCDRNEVHLKLLTATIDRTDLTFYVTTLYLAEDSVEIGELHLAISQDGDAWGMAEFELAGTSVASDVVQVHGSDAEDAAGKIYDVLDMGSLGVPELYERYGRM